MLEHFYELGPYFQTSTEPNKCCTNHGFVQSVSDEAVLKLPSTLGHQPHIAAGKRGEKLCNEAPFI